MATLQPYPRAFRRASTSAPRRPGFDARSAVTELDDVDRTPRERGFREEGRLADGRDRRSLDEGARREPRPRRSRRRPLGLTRPSAGWPWPRLRGHASADPKPASRSRSTRSRRPSGPRQPSERRRPRPTMPATTRTVRGSLPPTTSGPSAAQASRVAGIGDVGDGGDELEVAAWSRQPGLRRGDGFGGARPPASEARSRCVGP